MATVSMINRGYMQQLDTVNFSPDKQVGTLPALFDDAFINISLYSIFYKVTLSPNQVLDSGWLREKYRPQPTKTWPFILTVDSNVYNKSKPFTAQLLTYLRRPADKAFVFSSIPKNEEVAKKWGEKVKKEGKSLSDKELLKYANKFYEPIIEFASFLDSEKGNLAFEEYSSPKYGEIFQTYLSGSGLAYLDVPENRSQAYSWIAESALTGDKSKTKIVPNFISNVTYSIGTKSRLIIPPNSELEVVIPESNAEENLASLTLDLNGLFKTYKGLDKALLQMNAMDLAKIRHKVTSTTLLAWEALKKGQINKSKAKRLFSKSLSLIISQALEENIKIPEIGVEISSDPYSGVPSTSFKLPVVHWATFVGWKTKWNFRGLDRFINLGK